jgi:hypothetical protein
MVIPNPHTCPARMSRCTLQKLPANAVQFAPNRRPVSATSDVPQDTLTAQIADLTRVGRFPTLKSFTKPITQTEKTRPFWPRDESLPLQRPQSQTSECWNLRRRNKPRTAPHTGNGVTEHRSVPIRQSLARRLPGSVMRGLCQRGPWSFARITPRGLNLTRRTVSAPTTVADLIGDLAALHHRFVRGRVVGSGFCHSK